MIKGTIFDLDGVITDTAEYHFRAWKNLANSQGWRFDREVNETLRGVSRMDSIQIILDYNQQEISYQKKLELADMKNEIYIQSLNELSSKHYLPGIEQLLVDLQKAGLKIALGSSSKNARPVLDKLGATGFFDVIGDGNSVDVSKPDPGIFLFVANELVLNPSECIVIEDARSGVDAALVGGFSCIGIGPEDRVGHATVSFSNTSELTFQTISESFDLFSDTTQLQ